MTPPATGFHAPSETDLDEDWFGEGSAFDSGESLASALMELVGSRAGQHPLVPPEPPPLAVTPPPVTPVPRPADAAPPPGEFQVAAMPSFRGAEPARPGEPRREASGWRPIPRPSASPRGGWSIRQGVHILRTTEATLVSLREQAAERTWELVAAVYRDADV